MKEQFSNLVQLDQTIKTLDEPVFGEVSINGFHQKDFKAVVSAKTKKTLAVVSKKYCIVQSKSVLNQVVSALHKLDMKNVSGYVTETINGKTYARIMLPYFVEDNKGKIQVGFYISNSYDATMRVRLFAGAYRLICSNGMVIAVMGKESVRKHIGKADIDVESAVNRIVNTIIQNLPSLQKIIDDAMNDLIGTKDDADKLLKDAGFGKNLMKKIYERTTFDTNGQALTRWDLYNGVTNLFSRMNRSESSVIKNLEKAEKILVRVD